ncbi:MAG: tRNA uridine-5-carboxymethylaminomethyl(34) synthesis GTPase MnmE [Bryobacterales bacterium]|nr:tRNA uridine-5-carboxymethylaminomethyl(34) synthesis GTPase MnmE [Bryobacterales bacterium]
MQFRATLSGSRAYPAIHPDDTIVAVSTPPGRGGIGIVRLSGPQALEISEQLVRRPGAAPTSARRPLLGSLLDDAGNVVDEVLVTLFCAPKSYTAEDVVEISCHGSPAILAFTVERAVSLGARLAEPGEFTRRAFLNGRIDLAQAEAIRDLIDATTIYQARVALQQARGALSNRLAPVKQQLCDLIALLEAGIDFAEDDIDVASADQLLERLEAIQSEVQRLVESYRYGKVVRGGLTLAILGRPNVGKSSLFNRLLERERAIVTPQAGTTRDSVSEVGSIQGLPIQFIDTAGIRPTTDVAEVQGVERSYQALADADLVLVVIDLSQPLDETDNQLLAEARERGKSLVVGNKADLPSQNNSAVDLRVSAVTGVGMEALRKRIHDSVLPASGVEEEAGWITNLRHETLLRESLGSLHQAREAVENGIPHEMLLLDLYAALQGFDQITGATTVDDILANIFSRFCIGK